VPTVVRIQQSLAQGCPVVDIGLAGATFPKAPAAAKPAGPAK
jgi:hypothetical protein